jgi:hypothetical protein
MEMTLIPVSPSIIVSLIVMLLMVGMHAEADQEIYRSLGAPQGH